MSGKAECTADVKSSQKEKSKDKEKKTELGFSSWQNLPGWKGLLGIRCRCLVAVCMAYMRTKLDPTEK